MNNQTHQKKKENDMAYFFGQPPKSRPGRRVIPGRCVDNDNHGKRSGLGHPCPRKLKHMEYLVDKTSEEGEVILDPFLGSGTTAVACVNLNRRFIGIEILPEYAKMAQERVDTAKRQGRMFK